MSKIEKANQEKVLSHLKEKWAGRTCPMCLTGNFNLQDTLFEIREFGQGGFTIGGPVLPVVPVVCTNCGNTILVNAMISGAATPEPAQPVADKTGEKK